MNATLNGTGSQPVTDIPPDYIRPDQRFFEENAESDETAEGSGESSTYANLHEADPLDEETGAARHQLPTDLVRRSYQPIDAYFSPEPITLTAHILPSAGEEANRNAGGYEEAFNQLIMRYPLRAARLRNLYFRVEVAREHRLKLLQLDEEMRYNHNERNNTENARINKEIEAWRVQLAEAQRTITVQIAATHKELTSRKAELIEDLETTRKLLWELRADIAEEWDAMLQKEQSEQKAVQREWDASERAERRQQDQRGREDAAIAEKKRRDTIEQERLRATNELTVAEAEVAKAHADLCMIRQEIAAKNQTRIEAAKTRLESAKHDATREWEIIAAEIQSVADAVVQELRGRIEARREAVHAAHDEAARRQGVRQAALTAAEQKRAEVAAAAGIPVDAIDTLSHQELMYEYIPKSKSGKGDDPYEYLNPDEKQKNETSSTAKWRNFLSTVSRCVESVTGWLCLLVFGTIFGMSLGLLFTAFNFGVFSDPSAIRAAFPKLAVFMGIGIGVFTIMGRTIDHFVTLAVEAHGTANSNGERFQANWQTAVASFILVSFITIEAVIERYGIVGAYIDQQRLVNFGHPEIADNLLKQNWLAYWAIALIVALPFTMYHVGIAWRKAKAQVALAKNSIKEGTAQKEFLERLETHELLAAQNAFLVAKTDLEQGDTESRAPVAEAQRYLAEAEDEYATHPALRRRAEQGKEREEFFAIHTGIVTADAALEQLYRDVDNDPAVQVIFKRQSYWEEKRDFFQQHREQLLRELLETSTRVIGELIESVGETAGDTLNSLAASKISQIEGTAAVAVSLTEMAGDTLGTLLRTDAETVPFRSARLNAIEQRLSDLEKRTETDPKVVHYESLIKSLQTRLQRKEEATTRRVTSLKRQRRAIEFKPGRYLPAEISDADAQIQIAQGIFEKEYADMMRLNELPSLFRWFASIRRSTVIQDSVVTYVDNAMEERKKLPAIAAIRVETE